MSIQDINLSNGELNRITAAGLTIGSRVSQNIEVSGVQANATSSISTVVTLVATSQNAYIKISGRPSTFQALSVQADDGIDMEQDLTTISGSVLLNGDADNVNDGTSRDHISFGAGITITSALDIDLYARSGGIKLYGPLTLNAARFIYIHDQFVGPFGEHEVSINADTDMDFIGAVSVASRVCSVYSDSASCSASRLCGWCGYSPSTTGHGTVSTAGDRGTSLSGLDTSLTSDTAVGNMIMVDGEARVITALYNDTHGTINYPFERTLSGTISVFDGARDTIVGSTITKFDAELQPGYKVTVNGESQDISMVSSYKSATGAAAFVNGAENALFTIGNVIGSGTLTTDSDLRTVIGSWGPRSSKFKTQLKSGYVVTVSNVTRVVDSVIDNNHFVVTESFPDVFSNKDFKISNVPGTGTVSFNAGSYLIKGSESTPTAFTTDLRVGDVITTNGQTRMVQTVIDDNHASVASQFSSAFSVNTFTLGNIHTSGFTTAIKGTGMVSTNGTHVQGLGTVFGNQLELGQTITLAVGSADDAKYETRTITSISRDDILEVGEAYSATSSGVQFYYQTCPSQTAGLDESQAGTFNLHSKTLRPSMCYNNGRCVPRASHVEQVETIGSGYVYATAGSTTVNGIGTDFVTDVNPGSTIAVYGAIRDESGFDIPRQESQIVEEIISSTELRVASGFSFAIPQEENQQFKIRALTGRGTISSAGSSSTTVIGAATQFARDLAIGWTILLGDEKRVITSIFNETQMEINRPLNTLGGGVVNSAWAFESCMSQDGFANTFSVDYSILEPGCCGTKVLGSVASDNYAYYRITPPHSNYDVRIAVTSSSSLLDMTLRYAAAPDDVAFDFKAIGEDSPWQLELPQNRLICSNNTQCQSIYVGVKGLPGMSEDIQFEISSYLEFNYHNFVCMQGTGDESSHAVELQSTSSCGAISLSLVGAASATNDPTDPNNAMAIRLTSALKPGTVGSVWHSSKVHLENGFETTFTFKLASECNTPGSLPDCVAGDGFAFVIQSNTAQSIGCGGAGLGFANDASQGCTSGIRNSFAIEFDTWHNPELHDINLRGVGVSQLNATATPRYNFVHTAFFSEGTEANTVDHSKQLAGTPAIPIITDGQVHTARVMYIPGSSSSKPGRIFLYIDDLQSFVLTAPLRLTRTGNCGVGTSDKCVLDAFGNAYLGFTAAAGEIGQTHDIRDWNFCDEPNCGR